MKKIIIYFLLFSSSIYSQSFDTLLVKTIASGVTHYHIKEQTIPWNLNVLEIDLNNEYINIESAKGNGMLAGRATLSDFVESNTYDGHEVIGAINGDFFDDDGVPTGIQVLKGEILTTLVARDWSKVGFSSGNLPMINRPYYSGKVIANNNTFDLYGINRDRASDKLILYNGLKNSTTGTNQWGTEVVITPLGEWFVNDTLKFAAGEVEANAGDMLIERPSAVLSGHGLGKTFLDENITTGDTISLVIELLPGIEKLKEMVSGFPKIVKNGQNYALQGYAEEGGASTFATDRHPRTGVGISEDKSKLFFIVVDGRQPNLSMGMSLPELADFMTGIGVYTGLNLDGGGSSEMIVKNKIVNSPSDGPERAVGNSLLVVTSEPTILSELVLFPDTAVTDLNNPVQFFIEGLDLYGNKIEDDFTDADIILENTNTGSIDESLLFHPEGNGLTKLIARSGDAADTSSISVESYSGETLLHSFESLEDVSLSGQDIDTISTTMSLNSQVKSHGETSVELDYTFTYSAGIINWLYLNTDIPINGVPESISIDVNSNRTDHSFAFVITDENDEEFALLTGGNPENTGEFDQLTASFDNPISLNSNQHFYFPVRLKQVAVILGSDRDPGSMYEGTFYLDNIRVIYPEPTSLDQTEDLISTDFILYQNYPNPFNPTTTIEYSIPVSSRQYEVGSRQITEDRNQNSDKRLQNQASSIGHQVSSINNQVFVSLKVYDILGREVDVLVNEHQKPGTYRVTFNADDASGTGGGNLILSSGIYFYRLTANNISITKKLTLLK